MVSSCFIIYIKQIFCFMRKMLSRSGRCGSQRIMRIHTTTSCQMPCFKMKAMKAKCKIWQCTVVFDFSVHHYIFFCMPVEKSYWIVSYFLWRKSHQPNVKCQKKNKKKKTDKTPLNTISIVYLLQAHLFTEQVSWTGTIHSVLGSFGRWTLSCQMINLNQYELEKI